MQTLQQGLMALGLFIYLVYVLIKTGVLMTSSAFIQVLLYLGVLFMLAYPLAGFMSREADASPFMPLNNAGFPFWDVRRG